MRRILALYINGSPKSCNNMKTITKINFFIKRKSTHLHLGHLLCSARTVVPGSLPRHGFGQGGGGGCYGVGGLRQRALAPADAQLDAGGGQGGGNVQAGFHCKQTSYYFG